MVSPTNLANSRMQEVEDRVFPHTLVYPHDPVVWAADWRGQRCQIHLELELEAAVDIGSGNRAQVLYKNSTCSLLFVCLFCFFKSG